MHAEAASTQASDDAPNAEAFRTFQCEQGRCQCRLIREHVPLLYVCVCVCAGVCVSGMHLHTQINATTSDDNDDDAAADDDGDNDQNDGRDKTPLYGTSTTVEIVVR